MRVHPEANSRATFAATPIAQDDARTFAEQMARDLATNATQAAGYQYRLVSKFHRQLRCNTCALATLAGRRPLGMAAARMSIILDDNPVAETRIHSHCNKVRIVRLRCESQARPSVKFAQLEFVAQLCRAHDLKTE